MYVEYDDILSRVAEEPLWWLNGVPRFEPFLPQRASVYAWQVALVHTRCQVCAVRYDVAVEHSGHRRDLRSLMAYYNSIQAGDPPNARHNLSDCSGVASNLDEVAVLEFWHRDFSKTGAHAWQRDPAFERPLAEAEDLAGNLLLGEPVDRRIYASERREDFLRARRDGDLDALVAILTSFGCELPFEVADMLDVQRREQALSSELSRLWRERFLTK